jgi:hypothetical protein
MFASLQCLNQTPVGAGIVIRSQFPVRYRNSNGNKTHSPAGYLSRRAPDAGAVLSHDTSKELRPDEIPLIRNARALQFTAAGVD